MSARNCRGKRRCQVKLILTLGYTVITGHPTAALDPAKSKGNEFIRSVREVVFQIFGSIKVVIITVSDPWTATI